MVNSIVLKWRKLNAYDSINVYINCSLFSHHHNIITTSPQVPTHAPSPMHGAACPSSQIPIPPHLTYRHQDYATTVFEFFLRLSNTAIQSYVTNGEEKLLPSLYLCPITSYKTKGAFFNMETVLNNTFAMEKVFSPTTIKMLKNESVYSVKDVFSVLLGRCYMVTRHAI